MDSTILLTSSAPGIPGVGGVLIDAMLGCDGVEPVKIASIIDPAFEQNVSPFHADLVTRFDPVEEIYDPFHRGMIGTAKRIRRRLLHYDRSVATLSNRIVRYFQQNPSEQVWLILNSLATIDVAYRMLPKLERKLLVQVWDDAEHLALQRNCDRLTRKRTVRRFRKILAKADRTAVICEQMRDAYRPYVKREPMIIRWGVDSKDLRARHMPSHPSEFRIGLSGSMYCESEWRTLQRSCDMLQWNVSGRQIVLVTVGGKIEFRSRANAECRFYGWRPPAQTHDLMVDCDLLYLPQSNAPENDPLTRLSFPTKLSSYAATGRPILVHSPKKGSLRPFCEEHRFGVVCEVDDTQGMMDAIQKVANDDSFRMLQAEASCRIARQVLTPDAFAKGVRELLGVSVVDGRGMKNGQGDTQGDPLRRDETAMS